MADLAETGRGRGPDALLRIIDGRCVRILRQQRAIFGAQPVIRRIGNLRRVQRMITPVMMGDQIGEALQFRLRF